jgi:hypothetical protein
MVKVKVHRFAIDAATLLPLPAHYQRNTSAYAVAMRLPSFC